LGCDRVTPKWSVRTWERVFLIEGPASAKTPRSEGRKKKESRWQLLVNRREGQEWELQMAKGGPDPEGQRTRFYSKCSESLWGILSRAVTPSD
jgi:hypothetical protein